LGSSSVPLGEGGRKRLVLLVMHYLWHVIVHERGSYKYG
jgi:hypothetical protein